MSGKISIVQHGGGWITNIGNAFFDLGSMWAVDRALNRDARINLSSSFGRWTTSKLGRGPKDVIRGQNASISNVFDTGSMYDADYLVRAGAHLSKRWFDLHGDVLQEASQKGTKIIFHGVGFSEWSYGSDEIVQVIDWMKNLEPYAIISRDEQTYKSLKGIAEHTYNGIDCGFFVNDLHDPIPMREDYATVNFDKKDEPQIPDTDLPVVRPHHSFWYPWGLTNYPKMLDQYYGKDNIFVSDVPHEYLDVYAGSTVTHTDRVHACVATLAFGSPARLYIDTPRSHLLDRVGYESITEELTEPNTSLIEQEKEDQIEFLEGIL